MVRGGGGGGDVCWYGAGREGGGVCWYKVVVEVCVGAVLRWRCVLVQC